MAGEDFITDEFLEHLYNMQKSHENQMDITAGKLYTHFESILEFRDFSTIGFLQMGSGGYIVQTSVIVHQDNFQSRLPDGRRLFFIDGVVYFQRYVERFAPVMKGRVKMEPEKLVTIGIGFEVMKKSEIERMSL